MRADERERWIKIDRAGHGGDERDRRETRTRRALDKAV